MDEIEIQRGLRDVLRLADLLAKKEEGEKFYRMFPDDGEYSRDKYAKQVEFFNLGSTKPYRVLVGANGSGKSYAGAFEITCHLTGKYPDWWQGKRYSRAVTVWAAGVDYKAIRESLQPVLIGKRGNEGTGVIPRDSIVEGSIKYRSQPADSMDCMSVKHVSGGESTLVIKTYAEGRESFQAASVDFIWLDEEPDWSIYSECVQRFRGETREGQLILTFTPLMGASEVIAMFLPAFWPSGYDEAQYEASGRAHVTCTVDDVPHITQEEKERKIANTLPHERGPRLYGEVSVGEGRVYPFSEDEYVVDPVKGGLPRHWPRIYGMDPGLKVTAAVWGAHDPDTDIVYIYSEHYMRETLPAVHAQAIKARGHWIPGMIDPAGNARNALTGEAPNKVYRELGLRLKDADNMVEGEAGGIYSVYERFATGRLKIYRTCTELRRELRLYSRDDKNKIIKREDHACDALRYLVRGLKNAMLIHDEYRERQAPKLPELSFGIYG